MQLMQQQLMANRWDYQMYDKIATAYGSPTGYGSSSSSIGVPDDSTLVGRLRLLQQAVDHARTLVSLTESLADRISGSRPEKNEGGKPSPVPNGLCDEFGDAIENMTAALARIHDAARRAETVVG